MAQISSVSAVSVDLQRSTRKLDRAGQEKTDSTPTTTVLLARILSSLENNSADCLFMVDSRNDFEYEHFKSPAFGILNRSSLQTLIKN